MANGNHKAAIFSLTTLLLGTVAMFCAVYAHNPTDVTVPTYEDTVTQPAPTELTPDRYELEEVTVTASAPKRGSVMKLGESRQVSYTPKAKRCWEHTLEQQGRPAANTVVVCDF